MIDIDEKQKLAQLLISTKSFQYSPESPFQLVSGATSPYYFDLKLLNGDPEGIGIVAKILYNAIRKLDVKSVGGLAAGSISIATAISHYSWIEHKRSNGPLLSSFFVRKEQKQHGARKRIEGLVKSPVVIIDDVITSGMSALSAVNAVRSEKFECKYLMSIIFRGTKEQRDKITNEIPLESIFNQEDIVKYFHEMRDMSI